MHRVSKNMYGKSIEYNIFIEKNYLIKYRTNKWNDIKLRIKRQILNFSNKSTINNTCLKDI